MDRVADLWYGGGETLLDIVVGALGIALISYAMNFWVYDLLNLAPWAIWSVTGLFALAGGWANRRPA